MPDFAKKGGFVAFVLFFIYFLSAFSQQPVPKRPPAIELTSGNLSEYLGRLRANDEHPNDYLVKEPLRLSGLQEEWRVNNLSFGPEGVIYLGSTNLTIDIKGVLSSQRKETSVFRSFTDAETTAKGGANGTAGALGATSGEPASHGGTGGKGDDGQPGLNGSDSGDLTLHLRFLPQPGLSVSLIGQNGGNGGAGGTGGTGGRGQKGRAGSSGVFNCNRGGDNGGGGGAGGDGGNGGSGGNCGSGGRLTVIAPQTIIKEVQDRIVFNAMPAQAGVPGNPGLHGDGGPGGDGGDGNGFCSGGHPGPNGPPGRDGISQTTAKAACKAPAVLFLGID